MFPGLPGSPSAPGAPWKDPKGQRAGTLPWGMRALEAKDPPHPPTSLHESRLKPPARGTCWGQALLTQSCEHPEKSD